MACLGIKESSPPKVTAGNLVVKNGICRTKGKHYCKYMKTIMFYNFIISIISVGGSALFNFYIIHLIS